uniref:Uncharacterized protein n=1 Tax=Callorhinchus milii TaxID=7868 RepID=A0A4W3H4J0_CALMI
MAGVEKLPQFTILKMTNLLLFFLVGIIIRLTCTREREGIEEGGAISEYCIEYIKKLSLKIPCILLHLGERDISKECLKDSKLAIINRQEPYCA